MSRISFRIGTLVFIVFACFLAMTYVTYAAETAFVPLAETTGGPISAVYKTGNLPDFINGLFKFAIIIGAIAAVLRIAYAGYLYMFSDMWSQKGQAKEILADVTLGLLLLLSIYLILNQINPDILRLKALDVIKNNPASTSNSPTTALTSTAPTSGTAGGAGIPTSKVPDPVQAAIEQLKSEYAGSGTPPDEYHFTTSTGSPISGYYCFQETPYSGTGIFFSCTKRLDNCNRIARVAGTSCQSY